MTINTSCQTSQPIKWQPVRMMGAYDAYKKYIVPPTKQSNISLEKLKNALRHRQIYVIEKESGVTPLHWAIKKGNVIAVKALLQLGLDKANPNSIAELAAAENQTEILKLLANHEAPLNDALITAIEEGHHDSIKFLVDKHKSDGNIQELERGLCKAICIGNTQLAKEILSTYLQLQNILPLSLIEACADRLEQTKNNPDRSVLEILNICLKGTLDLSNFLRGFIIIPPSLLSVCTPRQLDQLITKVGYRLDHSSIEAMVRHNRTGLLKEPRIYSSEYCKPVNDQLRKYEPLYPKVPHSALWGHYTDPREYAGHLAVIENKIKLLVAIVMQKGNCYNEKYLKTAAAYGNRDICELFKQVFAPDANYGPILNALSSCSTNECFNILFQTLHLTAKKSNSHKRFIQKNLYAIIPEMLQNCKLPGALTQVIKEIGWNEHIDTFKVAMKENASVPTTLLYRAIEERNSIAVKELIDLGANPRYRIGQYNHTFLHIAVANNDLKTVKVLADELRKYPQFNLKNRRKISPLQQAKDILRKLSKKRRGRNHNTNKTTNALQSINGIINELRQLEGFYLNRKIKNGHPVHSLKNLVSFEIVNNTNLQCEAKTKKVPLALLKSSEDIKRCISNC